MAQQNSFLQRFNSAKYPLVVALFGVFISFLVVMISAKIGSPAVNKLANHSVVSLQNWLVFWNNFGQTWDGAYFVNIAQYGYSAQSSVALVKNELFAFFPLFPMEIRAFSNFFNGVFGSFFNLDTINSILIVSWFNSVLFCVCLYGLFTKYFQVFPIQNSNQDSNQKTSSKILLIISLALPFNFFYFVPYTESLFGWLFCSILWILLGFYDRSVGSKLSWTNYFLPIFCFLISLARSPGIVISLLLFVALIGINITPLFGGNLLEPLLTSPTEEEQNKIDKLENPFLLTQYLQNSEGLLSSLKSNLKTFWKINLILISSMFANILGLVSFLYYGYTQTGNFWISRDIQSKWGRGSDWNIYSTITNRTNELFLSFKLDKIQDYYNVAGVFLTIICFVIAIKYFAKNWFNLGLIVTSLAFAILPLSTGILFSYSRLFIICPIYFLFLPIFITRYINDKLILYLLIFCGLAFNLVLLGLFSLYSWVG